jgi:TRAP-type C4-dicarboxylate transport system substrate-binding protein
MNTLCLRFATGLVVAWLALPAARGQDVTVKLATLAPEGSSWHNILKEMGEEWRNASGGRVVLKIYPGGVAGDEADMVRKCRLGQLHAAAVTGTGLSEVDRSVQALQVPMLYRSNAEMDAVRQKLAPQLEARLRKSGFVVLNWGEAGWVHFFAKKPVERPKDLKALKLFTWAGDTFVLDLWKAGGFNAVPLPSTEILTGLQTGIIEAFATTPVAGLSFQWYRLAPHMSDMRWAPLIGATILSKQAWDRIPADARDGITKAARQAGRKLQADVRQGEADAIKAMKEHGLRVVSVPAEAAAEWRRSAEDIYPKLRGPFVPAEMFDEARRLVEEYRAKRGAAGGQ